MITIPSPCTKKCKLTPAKVCSGCFRTVNEIISWRTLSDVEKLKITEQLRGRGISD